MLQKNFQSHHLGQNLDYAGPNWAAEKEVTNSTKHNHRISQKLKTENGTIVKVFLHQNLRMWGLHSDGEQVSEARGQGGALEVTRIVLLKVCNFWAF